MGGVRRSWESPSILQTILYNYIVRNFSLEKPFNYSPTHLSHTNPIHTPTPSTHQPHPPTNPTHPPTPPTHQPHPPTNPIHTPTPSTHQPHPPTHSTTHPPTNPIHTPTPSTHQPHPPTHSTTQQPTHQLHTHPPTPHPPTNSPSTHQPSPPLPPPSGTLNRSRNLTDIAPFQPTHFNEKSLETDLLERSSFSDRNRKHLPRDVTSASAILDFPPADGAITKSGGGGGGVTTPSVFAWRGEGKGGGWC